jgi:hypothetical protein
MLRQALSEHAAGLNEETAINRFVRHPHTVVVRKLLFKPPRNLLRRPLLLLQAQRHVPTQARMAGQQARLGALGALPSGGFGVRGTVGLQSAIATDLSTDGGCRFADAQCDLP